MSFHTYDFYLTPVAKVLRQIVYSFFGRLNVRNDNEK
jgi:hypothetical protein